MLPRIPSNAQRSMPKLCAAIALSTVFAASVPLQAQIDPELLSGMRARSIGPAVMSGRVAAVEALEADPDVIYAGAATGGLWKTINGGLTWEPLFDEQPVAAIGAVEVYQAAPDIVWVGTGEGNPRNSASVGNGVYRSTDGGHTWKHLGLEQSERIARIVLHPRDPDIAWVAAMGPAWSDGGERGVYRTQDGGETWELLLSAGPNTGAADLVQDPRNPHHLLAAMWQYRRWPWFFRSGGPESGIYRSTDGGDSWQALTPEDGLPEGDLGRIGLAFAPSDSRIVYAVVEAEGKDNLLLASSDGGRSWETRARTSQQELGNRPFYYADLRVDPVDPTRVYSLWSLISVSEDGGRTWEILVPFAEVHPDHHALWIHPEKPEMLINGNDGGVYISHDRGQTWRFARSLPLAQLYHLRVDRGSPYHVFFGLQDNGSWRGPASVWENGGIRAQHWQEVAFGDGFDTVPDPEDSTCGYAMSQQGYVVRWDAKTGERRYIRPAPLADEEGVLQDLRFSWNAGIAVDPFEPATVYFGSQYLHRSKDRGETWEIVSEDLTSNDPQQQRQGDSGGLTPDVTGAENFNTIVSIAPSPKQEGLLWVGSDDGRLHRTGDAGESWTRLDARLPGVPAGTWIAHIEASSHDAAEAFVVMDNHRRGDWEPYVLHTQDGGVSWQRLAMEGVRGYALAIVQDPVDPDLLFLGTEFGLWMSLDRGENWLAFRHGVPTVSVMDLAIQPDEHDLVLGTHGRAVYVIDDIRPLRKLDAELMDEPLHLFPVTAAQQYRVRQTGAARFPGHNEFRGENEPYGARFTFSLAGEDLPHADPELEKERKRLMRAEQPQEEWGDRLPTEATTGAHEETDADASPQEGDEEEEQKDSQDPAQVRLVIRNAQGQQVREIEIPAVRGLQRVVWDLRSDSMPGPPPAQGERGEIGGFGVLPGSYSVTLHYGDSEASADFEVLPDPRFADDRTARVQRHALLTRARDLAKATVSAVEQIRAAEEDLDLVASRHQRSKDRQQRDAAAEEAEEEDSDPLLESLGELGKRLRELESQLWALPDSKGIIAEVDAMDAIARASSFLRSGYGPASAAERSYLQQAEQRLQRALDALQEFHEEELQPFGEGLDSELKGLLQPWHLPALDSGE